LHPNFQVNAMFRGKMLTPLPLTGCFILLLASTLGAQDHPATEVDKETRDERFSKMLSGSRFVGNFTVVGQELGKLTAEEYHIKSVQKMDEGDMWLFTARIKYGEHDVSVPVPLEVKWTADDTPVISVTDWSFFGIGPFSSRVVIYNGKYAGTWSHGEVHGHLFGTIEPGKAEGVDVEKTKREMEARSGEDHQTEPDR
jgi:hypothetical protein